MEKRQIIRRGKMVYYLTENNIVVDVGGNQFVSYNIYNSPSRSNLADFKKKIISSKPNQYDNATEQMDLAMKCHLIGSRTVKPSWGEE